MPAKLDYSTVKNSIESLGAYKLVTQAYEGSAQKLEILCLACDKTMLKTYPDFKKNQCADCGRARANAKKRAPIDEIRSFIDDKGAGDMLKSTIYVNEKTPIIIECGGCHKDYPITFVNFKHHDGRCPCKYVREYHTFESVSEFVKKRGDQLISTTYISIHDPLEIFCGQCKNKFPMTFHYYYDENKRCKCYTPTSN